MANTSLKAAFERMWQHTVVALDEKVDKTDISPSDWLASEGEAGHVLNRTHYVNSSEDIIIVPESTVTASRGGSVTIPKDVYPIPRLVVGDKYIINWNGVDYPCTVSVTLVNNRPMFVLGYHPSLVSSGYISEAFISEMYDKSIPVGIFFSPRVYGNVSKASWHYSDFTVRSYSIAAEGDTVTFSIRKPKEDVEKIDNKFIDSDWMAASELVELVPETTFTPAEHTLSSEGAYGWQADTTEVPLYVDYINNVGVPETLWVVFDGDTYYVDKTALTLVNAWGNVPFYNNTAVSKCLPEYTGLPFCVMNALTVPYVFVGDSNEHTIAIYAVKSNKIPNRFLPDDIANNATQVQIVTWGADD